MIDKITFDFGASVLKVAPPRLIGEILNEYLLHSNAPPAAAYRKHVLEMMASNESVDYIKKGERYD